ncbi:Serine/threonine-protein kinase PknD [Dyadobacter sp. CECT 9275]|uniref:Serine/threonine-protein kinase PknD n=1 Tax=Dyadobacter helix TaxID=2822344 RepID=A0A916NKH1_9BACT|nr:serine/threonine-protein kinase [Dyadobacter sp. CECT 9275]CAG4994729.1 Serine/threonine-protein kinase PknD [Dyadobacter sp. CECT 9275]
MTYEEFLKRYQFDTQDKNAMLGAGGFGSVYKAYDTVQKRYIAVKIAEVKHEKFNLMYEKQIVDELDSHENVARYGNCFRFTFMPVRYDFAILTFYEEGNLADVLNKYPLDTDQKHQILEGILRGVGHLHNHHIIHRDMKPQNVLMDNQNGRWVPKLTDFGLSKLADSNTRAVENSSIGLSIAYAAPEQISNRDIKHNVDLWAVGVIAYQMFVGELPFEAPRTMSQESWNLEVSKLIVNGKVSEKINAVPEPFKTIIEKCLVADNTQRVQKADELLLLLGVTPDYKPNPKPIILQENTLRIDEPVSNVKELSQRADYLVREAEGKSGFAREQNIHEAIKLYEEILRTDPANMPARFQLESTRQKLSTNTIKKTRSFSGKTLGMIAAGLAVVLGLGYFFYWKQKAKNELSWAKATTFGNIPAADTATTFGQIFQTLDKYAGTIAMDDTTNDILGTYYMEGRGGAPVSFEKAKGFFELAEDYAPAKFHMGYMYFMGKGAPKDYAAAAALFEAAYYKRPLVDAANNLGYIYLTGGYKVTQNLPLAKSWFEKAAEGNSAYAQFELGKMYLNGQGTVANSTQGRKYVKLAAEQGYPEARIYLVTININNGNNQSGSSNVKSAKASKPANTAGERWKKWGEQQLHNAIGY